MRKIAYLAGPILGAALMSAPAIGATAFAANGNAHFIKSATSG